MNEITKTPLCWPQNVPRTAPHKRGRPNFKERSLATAAAHVRQEINRLNDRRWDHNDASVIISSNLKLRMDGSPYSAQAEPTDSGIAVYFQLQIERNGRKFERPIVLSCDKWIKVADNLYAIGKDIEAQRSRERWGCTNLEQSFRGYLAIPERCGGASWWELLKVPSTATEQQIKDSYRNLAKTMHTDVGGNRDKWNALQEAYDQAMAAFRK